MFLAQVKYTHTICADLLNIFWTCIFTSERNVLSLSICCWLKFRFPFVFVLLLFFNFFYFDGNRPRYAFLRLTSVNQAKIDIFMADTGSACFSVRALSYFNLMVIILQPKTVISIHQTQSKPEYCQNKTAYRLKHCTMWRQSKAFETEYVCVRAQEREMKRDWDFVRLLFDRWTDF